MCVCRCPPEKHEAKDDPCRQTESFRSYVCSNPLPIPMLLRPFVVAAEAEWNSKARVSREYHVHALKREELPERVAGGLDGVLYGVHQLTVYRVKRSSKSELRTMVKSR